MLTRIINKTLKN